jgi:hypothetical protein
VSLGSVSAATEIKSNYGRNLPLFATEELDCQIRCGCFSVASDRKNTELKHSIAYDMEETRSSYVAPFNVDILEIIFDDLEPVDLLPIHFDRRFWERQSRTFIASLYLVSRLWLGPARRALYRAVTDLQELPDLLEKFHSTIKGNAAIRSCVRRLVLYLNDEWEMGSEIIGLLPSLRAFPLLGSRLQHARCSVKVASGISDPFAFFAEGSME